MPRIEMFYVLVEEPNSMQINGAAASAGSQIVSVFGCSPSTRADPHRLAGIEMTASFASA